MEADLGLFVGQLFPRKQTSAPLEQISSSQPHWKTHDWPARVGVLLEEEPSLEGSLGWPKPEAAPSPFQSWGLRIPALCRVFSRKQALDVGQQFWGPLGTCAPGLSHQRGPASFLPLSTPPASEGASARTRSLPGPVPEHLLK